MDTVELDLPETKTVAVRRLTFSRFTKPGFLCGGVLTVSEWKSRAKDGKPVGRPHVRRYAVQELMPDAKDRGARTFKLSKPLAEQGRAKSDDGPYHVYLGGRAPDRCVCKGYERAGRCVHILCLRELSRHGKLPPVQPWALPKQGVSNETTAKKDPGV